MFKLSAKETDSIVLIDCQSGRLLTRSGDSSPEPPGSTVKPLVVAALLRTGKLRPDESLLCRGTTRIAGRVFDCSHPPVDIAMHADTALAYSCNAFVSHFALRFTAAQLAAELSRAGCGAVRAASTPDELQLQAL